MKSALGVAVALWVFSLGCPGPGPGPGKDAGPPAPDAGPDGGVDQPDAGADAGPVALWPLSGIDADLPDDDLAPLAGLLAGKDVIGIGESVHTTGGELRMRARLIRFLVESHGVRAIALENEWENTERVIVPYVETCAGTPEDAARGMNPIWWDVSTPDLMQWLCEYNQAHPADPVRVMGVDIRQAWYDLPALTMYLQQAAPGVADALADGLATCLGAGYADAGAFFADPAVQGHFAGTPTPEAEHEACLDGADAASAYFEAERDALIAASSEREYERARLRVVGMRAFDLSIYHLSRGSLEEANPPRDAAMADVFTTFRRLDFPGARTIVFAHNGHILHHSDEVLAGQWVGVKNLGTLVHEQLGPAYAAVGQLSRTTHINWTQGPQTLEHFASDDLEFVIGTRGLGYALLDPAAAVALDPPLWSPDTGYDVGFDTLVPDRHYDALVFHLVSPANDYFATPAP